MSTEEVLLVVLTTALVIQILVIIAVLIAAFILIKRIKKTTENVQHLTEKGTVIAERLAPLGGATVGVFKVMQMVIKKRK